LCTILVGYVRTARRRYIGEEMSMPTPSSLLMWGAGLSMSLILVARKATCDHSVMLFFHRGVSVSRVVRRSNQVPRLKIGTRWGYPPWLFLVLPSEMQVTVVVRLNCCGYVLPPIDLFLRGSLVRFVHVRYV
jgi:hypothetical protein